MKLLWQPNDWYSAEFSASHSDTDSPEGNLTAPLRGSIAEAEQLGLTVSYAEDRASDEGQILEAEVEQSMLFLTQEISTSNVAYRSLTGWVSNEDNDNALLDGSALPILGAACVPCESESFSQEFQAISDNSGPFNWILGASYFDGEDQFQPTTFGIGIGGFFQETFSQVNTETLSLYAEGEYAPTQRLTLTAGVRYIDEERELEDGEVVQTLTPPAVPAEIAPLVIPTDVPGDKTSWDDVTWRVVLNYALTDNVNVYYSNARGFKSGVYNAPALNVEGPNEPVDPETLDSNEIGMKGSFLDGTLRVNAAVFMYDLTDTQAQVALGTGVITALASAGDSELTGGEVEISYAPTDNLVLNVGAAFLDSEYKDFDNFPASVPSPTGGVTGAGGNISVVTDVRGNSLVRAPDMTVNFNATYTAALASGSELSFTGTWYYNDGYCFESACRLEQDSYDVLNASVSYTTADQKWKITGWVNNVTDEDYYRVILPINTGDLGLYNRGTYGGARAEYRF